MSNTIVNTNVSALNSHRAILSVGGRQARSAERLSSGMRINRAADDAAGLAISEKMRNQIRGLDQATRNSQDGISLVQTAEGALEEIHRILERARELTNQAANDTNTPEDRQQIQAEIAQIMDEIDQIANNTEFNTQRILSGHAQASSSLEVTVTNAAAENFYITVGGLAQTGVNPAANVNVVSVAVTGTIAGPLSLQVQTGANSMQRLDVTIDPMNLEGLGLTAFAQVFEYVAAGSILTGALIGGNQNGLGAPPPQYAAPADQIGSTSAGYVRTGGTSGFEGVYSSGRSFSSLLNTLDAAIQVVSTQRANLGAIQNRLEHTINNLQVASENLSAANSRIRDTDMAAEMMRYTQANVLQQAGMSMLAQANMAPQNVLQLLG